MNNVNENMIKYRVTYLEMINYPNFNWPITPKQKLNILLSENIPDWYFLFLYKTIGLSYDWTDQINKTEEERNIFINNENVKFFTLIKQGWTAGFYILDFREKFVCDLSYIGLVPDAIGKGLGKFLFKTAILSAWEKTNINKLTVNTCSLDHKNALPLYQKLGFNPVRFEELEKSRLNNH
ncbi:GNAT family N-acetyltransferase [Alphaproteobacteria bacterium]|nr:GNAT family N-acetyltransferase [Alphaproteobacteria bacterium]